MTKHQTYGGSIGFRVFKRRIKTQTVLPSADTAAMLFVACFLSDKHAQSRWLENPHRKTNRSAIGPRRII
jgi:hypothetical protein